MSIRKVNTDFIRKSFTTKGTVLDYANAVSEIGLWESELCVMAGSEALEVEKKL